MNTDTTPVVLALLVGLLLAGCQTPAPVPAPPPVPVCPEPPPLVDSAAGLHAVLAYAAELRERSGAELAREVAQPHDGARGTQQAMRRALLLAQQGRTAAELLQASAQLDLVAAASDAEAQQLKPLAALLGARLAEQRRLLDSVDKLGAQLREAQRRNDQLSEKLEALKAIEQTLPVKPATAPR